MINMMKRIISVLLASAILFTGCAQSLPQTGQIVNKPAEKTEIAQIEEQMVEQATEIEGAPEEETLPDFKGLGDENLLQYVEDAVYAGLEDEFASEDYIIENVEAIYYSQEYLDEYAYNSKSNIWFGYTSDELNSIFQGERYVFDLGEDGQTVVKQFEDYDDTYERVIRNVAIGTGVVLVCVVVSVVTYGAGAVPVSMIFAASAKTAAIMAVSSGAMSAVAAGAITAVTTHDKDKAIKAAALEGSEAFKWGAIIGAISGGVSEAVNLSHAAKATQAIDDLLADPKLPEWRRAELRALKQYGVTLEDEQLAYLAGEKVAFNTPGATRPDVVRTVGNHLEAIEVKYYNLNSPQSLNTLYSELEREVSSRVLNLPANSTQRVVLDVTGRNFSAETIKTVTETIQSKLFSIYGSNIPVDIVGAVL